MTTYSTPYASSLFLSTVILAREGLINLFWEQLHRDVSSDELIFGVSKGPPSKVPLQAHSGRVRAPEQQADPVKSTSRAAVLNDSWVRRLVNYRVNERLARERVVETGRAKSTELLSLRASLRTRPCNTERISCHEQALSRFRPDRGIRSCVDKRRREKVLTK